MSIEHRRAERKQLKRFLTVLDGSSGSVLGSMVDISSSGMMLICRQPLAAESRLLVDIQIPRPSKNLSLKLQATCMWMRHSTSNQNHYGCGLRFDNLSAEQELLINRLILNDASL